MGTMNQGPLVQDGLMVKVEKSSLIFSSEETERKSMFLSNIDQVLNFDVQTLHFFPANPDYPPKVAAEKIKEALQKSLAAYDFLAGRMKLNTENGRFEFDCNNAGIGFVVASSECRLDDIGDLVYPNPDFEQLITKSMGSSAMEDHPLCIVQVTSFKCDGFAMGIQTNHATFDGTGFKTFLQNLAALAGDRPLPVVPCNDRTLLCARSPPRVDFPHHELLKLNTPLGPEIQARSNDEEKGSGTVFADSLGELDFKVFRLSAKDIADLKSKAKEEGPTMTNGKSKVTGFNVVSAHIWRCKALSFEFDAENNNNHPPNPPPEAERSSTILFAIDIRGRLEPPLPATFTGNAVLTAYATATCKEIEEAPLSRLVGMVAQGSARMTDEYARSAIDWGELYKGFPNGEFLISSWWRLGFNEVEYPWGRPKYSCPLVYKRKDIILLFPDIEGASSGGVNVLVALPHKEMAKFQHLFYKYL